MVYVMGAVFSAALITGAAKVWKLVKGAIASFKELVEALLGEKPTEFKPNPPPGALAVLKAHAGTLDSLDKSVGVVLTVAKVLLDQREAPRTQAEKADGHDLTPSQARELIEQEQRRRVTERTPLTGRVVP